MKKCIKCTASFPLAVLIDGRAIRLHSREHCLKCVPLRQEIVESDKCNVDIIGKSCVKCFKQLNFENVYFTKKRGKYIAYKECMACFSNRSALLRKEHKRILVEEAGGKCIACGYAKSLAALHFHHREAETKKFSISAKINRSLNFLRPEAAKCDLLCANCHAERHETEGTEID